GRGVRVVDDDGFLVVVEHLEVDLALLLRVELEERHRARRIEHRDVPGRRVGALWAGHHPARLVAVVPARTRDDRVEDPGVDAQHAPSLPKREPRSAVTGLTP